jgi:murein DD-endopeptidase MepM/ murein hydrolase activator NlpD
MRTPLLRWLSLRLRILLVLGLLGSTLLPPYIPSAALSPEDAAATAATQQFLFVEDGFLMKSSSVGTAGSQLAYSDVLVYKAKQGDSVEKVAAQYHLSPQTVRWANGLSASAKLHPDQELIILPVDGTLHTVSRGQTLGKIAQIYGISTNTIAKQNKIQGGYIIPGEQLIIPGAKPVAGSPAVVASVGEALRFADELPSKDIQLRLGSPTIPGTARAPAISALITQTLLQSPCGPDCRITQGYQPGHYAVDMQVRGGGPIYAAEEGTVIRADWGYDGGYGNVIEIDHGNGLITLYAHNKELYVHVGDHVKRGQAISFMGNTGRVHGPTGIHTHFEVRVNGVKKNPLLYLE